MPDHFDRERFAANEARNTVASLLHRYGGEQFPAALRRAILPQPFVLRPRVTGSEGTSLA